MKVILGDGEQRELPKSIISQSRMLSGMFDAVRSGSDCDSIPLQVFTTDDWRALQHWHEKIDCLENCSHEELLSLLFSSDYLDMPLLYTSACKEMARIWSSRRPTEIRHMLGIANADLSDSQERARVVETLCQLLNLPYVG